nr:MAG TPA: hypothetical protein [Caudoviricetes sp.]
MELLIFQVIIQNLKLMVLFLKLKQNLKLLIPIYKNRLLQLLINLIIKLIK